MAKKLNPIYKKDIVHILKLIWEGENTNKKISDSLKIKPPSSYQQIKYLVGQKLIIPKEEEKKVFNQKEYFINFPKINSLFFEWLEERNKEYKNLKISGWNIFLVLLIVHSFSMSLSEIQAYKKTSTRSFSVLTSYKKSNLKDVFEHILKWMHIASMDTPFMKKAIFNWKRGIKDFSDHLDKHEVEFLDLIQKVKKLSDRENDYYLSIIKDTVDVGTVFKKLKFNFED